MKFNYYFFKENTRNFDRADLYDYLADNQYITLDTTTRQSETIAYYDNQDIDLKAKFIFTEKSVVSDIHRISPQYKDLNFRLELEIMNPNYKLNKLLNLVEVICKRHQFFIYNETLNDCIPFKRSSLVRCYSLVKQAYKVKHEEEFMQYSKLDSEELERVYYYVENKDSIEKKYKDDNLIPLPYEFYRMAGGRKALVAVKWDGIDPFIVPDNATIFVYDDGITRKMISYEQLKKNIIHEIRVIGDELFPMFMINPKKVKKIKKHIVKTAYSEPQTTLRQIDLESILDI